MERDMFMSNILNRGKNIFVMDHTKDDVLLTKRIALNNIWANCKTMPQYSGEAIKYIFRKLGVTKGYQFMNEKHLYTTHELIKHFNIPVGDISKIPNLLFSYDVKRQSYMYGSCRVDQRGFEIIKGDVDLCAKDHLSDKFDDLQFNHPVSTIRTFLNSGLLSDRQIAKKTGIPQPTITRYHNGSRKIGNMNIDIANKIFTLYFDIKRKAFKAEYNKR